MDEKQLQAIKQRYAQSLDGMTVEEIADLFVRGFFALADETEKLISENQKLRKQAA